MRIAIVNDRLLAIEAIRRILLVADGHQVAWIARNGAEAVALCARARPDLILMDLFMPEMDGVEATRRIMAHTPCAIVVVTANVSDHAAKVFEAMGAGALDAVNTPVLGIEVSRVKGSVSSGAAGPLETENLKLASSGQTLLAKIETIRRLIGPVSAHESAGAKTPIAVAAGIKQDPLVVMGASAGGPAALASVLSGLAADFPAAVAIVQHVDAQFARGLADWLGGQTPLRMRLAEEGDRPEAGTVLLAGREFHLVLTASLRWSYLRAPADCIHRPSVDALFESVSDHWKGMAVGVLLTGMGRDGAAGLQMLRKHGHYTIAQDQATSAVYGMPKAAVELNAAREILALDKIGARLTNIVVGKTRI